MRIEDGTGQGSVAQVTKKNELRIRGAAVPIQHAAAEEGLSFQSLSIDVVAAGAEVVHLLQNDDDENNLVVTYIRVQAVDLAGGTAPPDGANYFSISKGEVYDSGGTELDEVNCNFGAAKASGAVIYNNDPTLAGIAEELDRWYVEAQAKELVYVKEGSIIITPGQALAIKFTTDNAGITKTRISYYVEED